MLWRQPHSRGETHPMLSEFGAWAVAAATSGAAAVTTAFMVQDGTMGTVLDSDVLLPAGVVVALFGVAVTASVKMTRLYMTLHHRLEEVENDLRDLTGRIDRP